jgi:hypothetical protein
MTPPYWQQTSLNAGDVSAVLGTQGTGEALRGQYGYNFPYAYIDMNYAGEQLGGQCYFSPDYAQLSDDQANIPAVLQHEIMEAITDPRMTLYYPSTTAWAGQTLSGAFTETGDMCEDQQVAIIATQPRTFPHYIQTAIQHISDKAPNGQCVYARATRGDFFTVGGSTDHLWHQKITADSSPSGGNWYDWGLMGTTGTLQTSPAAVAWAPGRQDVFVVDSLNHLRHAYVDKTSTGCPGPNSPCYDDWGVLPSPWAFAASQAVGVASWGPGRLDVFAMAVQSGSDPHLFHRIWDTGAIVWQDRGAAPSPMKFGPAAVSYGPQTVDVFVVGTDENIYRGTYTQLTNKFSWTLWHAKPSSVDIAHPVDVAESSPGQFDVMVIDNAGAMYDCGGDALHGAWTNCVVWSPPTGLTFVGKPSVVGLGDQRLLVGAHGSDGSGWVKLYDFGQNTGAWVSIGGALTFGPDLSSW